MPTVAMSPEEFCDHWNSASSPDEAAAAIGRKQGSVQSRASKLRAEGYQLKIMPYNKITSIDVRFWARVNKTKKCWLWTGSKNTNGYGKIMLGRRGEGCMLVHRLSWEIHFGPIADGLHVCHRCDTPLCIRPDHLFLGTDKDNIHDMMSKGRGWWQKKEELSCPSK